MKISLILLVKNGAKHLEELFASLEKQTVKIDEIVVVDSGSTDGSLEIIKSLKVKKFKSLKLFQIKSEEFSHGGTRNFAIRQAQGEIIVFVTQDAVPQSEKWLATLIKPFEDKEVAGVFGKQVPWPETNLCEKFFYRKSYPDQGRVMEKKESDNFSNQNIFFSNVNSAVKKEFLLKFPFREDLVMSEDQFWGREMLCAGSKIVYEPKAPVWHSHNYNLVQLLKRYSQSGYSQRQMNLKGQALQKGTGTALGLWRYVAKTNLLLLPYAVLYVLLKGGAFILGRSGVCF